MRNYNNNYTNYTNYIDDSKPTLVDVLAGIGCLVFLGFIAYLILLLG